MKFIGIAIIAASIMCSFFFYYKSKLALINACANGAVMGIQINLNNGGTTPITVDTNKMATDIIKKCTDLSKEALH